MELSRFVRRPPGLSLASPLSSAPAAVTPENEGMPLALPAAGVGAGGLEADEDEDEDEDEDDVCVVFSVCVCVCVALSCWSRSVHRCRILQCRENRVAANKLSFAMYLANGP